MNVVNDDGNSAGTDEEKAQNAFYSNSSRLKYALNHLAVRSKEAEYMREQISDLRNKEESWRRDVVFMVELLTKLETALHCSSSSMPTLKAILKCIQDSAPIIRSRKRKWEPVEPSVVGKMTDKDFDTCLAQTSDPLNGYETNQGDLLGKIESICSALQSNVGVEISNTMSTSLESDLILSLKQQIELFRSRDHFATAPIQQIQQPSQPIIVERVVQPVIQPQASIQPTVSIQPVLLTADYVQQSLRSILSQYLVSSSVSTSSSSSSSSLIADIHDHCQVLVTSITSQVTALRSLLTTFELGESSIEIMLMDEIESLTSVHNDFVSHIDRMDSIDAMLQIDSLKTNLARLDEVNRRLVDNESKLSLAIEGIALDLFNKKYELERYKQFNEVKEVAGSIVSLADAQQLIYSRQIPQSLLQDGFKLQVGSNDQVIGLQVPGGLLIAENQVETWQLYRQFSSCPSCQLRIRNASLSSCSHVLCLVCLEMLIKSRNRKCPVCKTPFDASDVKELKF